MIMQDVEGNKKWCLISTVFQIHDFPEFSISNSKTRFVDLEAGMLYFVSRCDILALLEIAFIKPVFPIYRHLIHRWCSHPKQNCQLVMCHPTYCRVSNQLQDWTIALQHISTSVHNRGKCSAYVHVEPMLSIKQCLYSFSKFISHLLEPKACIHKQLLFAAYYF